MSRSESIEALTLIREVLSPSELDYFRQAKARFLSNDADSIKVGISLLAQINSLPYIKGNFVIGWDDTEQIFTIDAA